MSGTQTLTPEGQRLADARQDAWLAYRFGTPENRGPGWNDSSPSSAWDAAWDAAALLLNAPEGDGAGLREATWRCPKCRCNTFAAVDERKPDGSFGPGDLVRCVNCKGVFFSALTKPPAAQEPAAAGVVGEIAAERRRQIEAEGCTPEHDDTHSVGEMALAASAYAFRAQFGDEGDTLPPGMWPWDRKSWKVGPARRMLVTSGALIVAEIERLDRVSGATLTPAAPKTPRAGRTPEGEAWIAETDAARQRVADQYGVILDSAATGGSVGDGGLREALARHFEPVAFSRALIGCRGMWEMHRDQAYKRADSALAQPAPVGEDETGVRDRYAQVIHDHTCKSMGLVEWAEIIKHPRYRDDYAAKRAYALADALLAAPQPPKAETPAGVVQILEEFVSEFGSTLENLDRNGPDCRNGEGEYIWASAIEDRRDLIERGRAILGLCSTAPAARPGDEVEREALALITDEAGRYTCFRSGDPKAPDSLMLTVSVPLGLARKLDASLPRVPAAAPAADGGRNHGG